MPLNLIILSWYILWLQNVSALSLKLSGVQIFRRIHYWETHTDILEEISSYNYKGWQIPRANSQRAGDPEDPGEMIT